MDFVAFDVKVKFYQILSSQMDENLVNNWYEFWLQLVGHKAIGC